MKTGCMVTVLAAAALVVTLVATCPDRRAHKEALGQLMKEVIDERVESSGGLVGRVLGTIGKMTLEQTGGLAIDQLLTVDDYYVVSVGRVTMGQEHRVVSVGVLGHVFTPDKDDVMKMSLF